MELAALDEAIDPEPAGDDSVNFLIGDQGSPDTANRSEGARYNGEDLDVRLRREWGNLGGAGNEPSRNIGE